MDTARIAALLAPFLPDPGEPLLQALSTYLDLLLRWNARLNLTAVRDPDQIVTRHFGESLFVASRLFPAGGWPTLFRTGWPTLSPALGRRVGMSPATGDSPSGNRELGTENCLLDLGSGAGFPGVPIKLYEPGLQLTLIESQYRKAIFLRELLRALALPGAQVFSGRAQDFPPPPADVPLTLTLRAVERFDQVLPLAARLLHPHSALNECHPERALPSAQRRTRRVEGPLSQPEISAPHRLALLIGSAQIERARALLAGFAWDAPIPIPQSSARVLLVGSPTA